MPEYLLLNSLSCRTGYFIWQRIRVRLLYVGVNDWLPGGIEHRLFDNGYCGGCGFTIIRRFIQYPESRMKFSFTNQAKLDIKGVQGFLLLFCVGRTIFSPLVNIYGLVSSFKEIQEYIWIPQFLGLLLAIAILTLCEVVFGIVAGIELWRVKGHAVKLAKTYLFTSLCLVAAIAVVPILFGFPAEVLKGALPNVLRSSSQSSQSGGCWIE